jgi:hypothetical protein
MIRRRTVLGVGLALTGFTSTNAFGAFGPTANHRQVARAIDALLIDETIEMSRLWMDSIEANRRTLPVLGIQLDAASHAELGGVLGKSQRVVGISSGATLFCVERIAWDHGFRLTARIQSGAGEPGDDTCGRDFARVLHGALPLAASPSSLMRAYRPSRMDGTLHAWTLQRTAGPQTQHGRQELQP